MRLSFMQKISSFGCKLLIFFLRLKGHKIKLDLGSEGLDVLRIRIKGTNSDLTTDELKSKKWITANLPKPNAPRPFLFFKMKHLLLDATCYENWSLYFSKNSIDMICSEHVFEHFDDYELDKVLRNIRTFLSHKGNLRIAVPDGNRPDIKYIDRVAPPIDGHKQLFTIDSLSSILESNGFIVQGLEYYKDQKFFSNKYDESDGLILRCFENDTQVEFQYSNHYYTSIIVDCSLED